jgi:predicted porin
MFQKKTLVVAVAGALGMGAAGVALAQTTAGNVEIYGRLYPEFTVMSSGGATPTTATVANGQLSNLSAPATGLNLKSRNSIDVANSRIGFRGTEDLGRGLKTVWQIEQKVTFDTGASGTLANRDSFVGLAGAFGTVRLGNMTTVYKDNREPIRALVGTESGNTASASNVLAAAPWAGATTFHLRRANSVRYDSPSLGGLIVQAQYSPDEVRKVSPGSGNQNADLWSLGLKYENGPLWATLSHEIHKDMFGASGSLQAAVANSTSGAGDIHAKDTATRGVVAYRWGPARVSLSLSTIRYTESGTRAAGKFDNFKHNPWELAWEHTWTGAVQTVVAYVGAPAGSCGLAGGVACSTTGLDGKMLILGAAYSFSKRTALFGYYTKITNGASSMYNNAANAAVDPGGDVTNVSFGIRHDY